MNNAKPISYFFADPNTFGQDAWAAFGPRGDNAEQRENQFSLTSMFSSWSGKVTNAYAICKGVVFIQPQTDSELSKVNVILRPIDQPFPGVKIKYFVYRGLRKEDFFNGEKVLASSSNQTSDFINKININFANFYTSRGQTVPDFLARYIGFDPVNQPASMLLDDFFFKQATYTQEGGIEVEDPSKSFELPIVHAGASLGRFLSGDNFGMDVVLDYGDYREPNDDTKFVFDLNYMRAWRAEKTFWWPNDPDLAHKKKQHKEQVLQFLDILAYYGAHAADGIVKAKIGSELFNKTGTQIYTDLLGTSYGKNRWYFYIQSDRTRSYNFYGNYTVDETNPNTIRKGYAENAMWEDKYITDGWPIMIDEAVQSHSETSNSLFLQFTKTPNNPSAMFYAQIGDVVNVQHNNFCDADYLSLPDAEDGTASQWTKSLQFTVPSIAEDAMQKNIGSFAIILYQGRDYVFQSGMEPNVDNVYYPIYRLPNYFDEVFDGLDAEPMLKDHPTPNYFAISNSKIRLISHYYNQTFYGISAVQTARVNDAIVVDDGTSFLQKRVTFIAESVDTLNDPLVVSDRVNLGALSTSSVTSSNVVSSTYQLPAPFYYQRQPFRDGEKSIIGLRLKTTNGSIPDRIMLGITELENNRLRLLTTIEVNNGVRNTRLFLIDLFEDGKEFVTPDGLYYQKYRLGIVGEEWNGNLKLFLPEQDVIVYGLDRFCYFTEEYSKYVKEKKTMEEYLVVNKVY
ncbi:hypothetical protein [Pedobacter ureilyticus]|uniref:Uncharacterized protein n=1 Tax=Pedobacter ureilyticus TaxID=1393051 RepID=A0ABW9J872_9SPHI|nr:hypothetical protein [Pedobacter helvus]